MPGRTALLGSAFSLLCLVFSVPGKSAQNAIPGAGDQIEEIEQVEEIEEIGGADSADGSRLGIVKFVGRFHPVTVHFPIAWLVLLLLVETVALFTGMAEWSKAGLILLSLALLSFLPALATGYILASQEETNPRFLALMVPHRNLNIAAAVACLTAWILRIKKGDRLHGSARWPYFMLVTITTLLVLIASHYGGKMVYGETYFHF